jgi:signal transduction histidine kinase
MNPFGIASLLTGLSSLGFGLFVFFKCPNRRVAKIWFLFSLSIAGWGFGALMFSQAKNPQTAIVAWRLTYLFGVLWISPLFYHFVCIFLELRRPKSILLQYVLSVFFLLCMPSRLFFRRIDFLWNSIFVTRSGIIHVVFFIWWISLVIYSHCLLLQALPNVSPSKKNQIKYFFIAMLMGFSFGSLNFLYNFGVDIYPWVQFPVCLYPVIMAYAILKHRLMEITFVIRKTLLYSLMSAILAAIYGVTVTVLAFVLGTRHGVPSAFSYSLATVVITLLFNPLRVKIQRLIDRYFFRESLDQEILREATSGFVHEIKRPLANISLPAELCLMDLQDLKENRRPLNDIVEKMEQRLQYILHQTADAGDKIEAIRGSSAAHGTYSESINLKEVIQKSLYAQEALLKRHQVKLILDINAGLPFVQGHEKQLEIVVSNLIKNAAEAMALQPIGAERKIQIKAHPSKDKIALTVEDSGPGIKREHLERLFEPYFTTKGVQGMGIGLYLSRQLLKAQGGSIEIQSEEGQGARCTVHLSMTAGKPV